MEKNPHFLSNGWGTTAIGKNLVFKAGLEKPTSGKSETKSQHRKTEK